MTRLHTSGTTGQDKAKTSFSPRCLRTQVIYIGARVCDPVRPGTQKEELDACSIVELDEMAVFSIGDVVVEPAPLVAGKLLVAVLLDA